MAVPKLKLQRRLKSETGPKAKAKKTRKAKAAVIKLVKRDMSDPVDAVVLKVRKAQPKKAAIEIKQLNEDRNRNYVHIGGLLAKIRDQKWYRTLYKASGNKPYESFGDFVRARYGWTSRTAMYMISSFDAVNRFGLHDRHLRGIGWSKFRLIASPGVMNEKNKDRWLALARKKSMVTLESAIKKAKAAKGGVGGAVNPGASDDVKNIRFALHKAQYRNVNRGLAEAMRINKTEYPSVALDYIVQHFLASVGGGKVAAPTTLGDVYARLLTERTQENAFDVARKAFKRAFPGAFVKLTVTSEKNVAKASPKKAEKKASAASEKTHAPEGAEAA